MHTVQFVQPQKQMKPDNFSAGEQTKRNLTKPPSLNIVDSIGFSYDFNVILDQELCSYY